jgi:membrane protease YdiL (CAAX protease family)
MIGLLIELIASWLLLWLFERKDLLALGISPTRKRPGNFLFGFLIASLCCAIYYFSFTINTNNHWQMNPTFNGKQFGFASWWTLTSVLYEELIFRGALLFMFAMAFAKTRSLYLPAGLHLGWNLLNTVVFSEGPLGHQFLILKGEERTGIALSLAFYLFQVFAVPLITYWYIKWQLLPQLSVPASR